MAHKRKLIALASVAALLVVFIVNGIIKSGNDKDYSALLSLKNDDIVTVTNKSTDYAAYLSSFSGMPDYDGEDIVLNAEQLLTDQSTGFTIRSNQGGRTGNQIQTEEDSEIVFSLEIQTEGFYEITASYMNQGEGVSAAERELEIDGELPFDESYNIALSRLFKDADEVRYDAEGNQIRASQEEIKIWQDVTFSDKRGFYRDDFKFFFTKGIHTVTIKGKTGVLLLAKILLTAPKEIQSYEEYRKSNPGQLTGETACIFESENTAFKSATNVRAEWVNDPLASPKAVSLVRYNAFGGTAWKDGGQFAGWEIDVPEDGYYTLAFRYTVPKSSAVVYREIKIDGAVPFDLFSEYPFANSNGFELLYLKDNKNEPIQIYLAKGKHTITLEAKVGPIRKVVSEIETATDDMDSLFRKITLITASMRDANGQIINDANRDYNLEKKIPLLDEALEAIAQKLENATAILLEQSLQSKPQELTALQRASKVIRKMQADSELIPQMMNEYTNILVSLNTCAAAMLESPLYLDYLSLSGSTEKLDNEKSGIFSKLEGSVESLVHSFMLDYSSSSESTEDEITVWVARGRDWANIINQLSMDDFTNKTDIKVNINILPQLSDYMVLTSYSGGNSPDIAMGMSQGTSVEFAARNAAVDLKDFSGFGEIKSQLVDGSLIPFEYKDGIYALPETLDFQVMFYRIDIFEELGLQVPNTWKELYKILPVLQENGMDFYYPSGAGGFAPFLYQNGGSYYSSDGTQSLLATYESICSFTEFIELFSKYKVPLQADLFQRMRMGTIPIGIGGYDVFTKLTTAAPELTGKWAIALMPGTEKQDGSIDRSAPSGETSVIMLKSAQNKDAAWEYMRWWVSKENQIKFGTEIENLLGAGSRWNTANVEAMKNLNWSKKDLKVILGQWEYFQTNPTILGGYFTDRQMLTAWTRSALNGESPRIVLEDAVRKINKELKRKQLEFE